MAPSRLIFVTGKGGTGKSTIAAALALGLSRLRPVTLADLEGRSSAARALGAQGATIDTGHGISITALSQRTELEAFIRRIVPLRAISRRMLKSRTFGYVTAALPGLESFLVLERMRLMAADAALEDCYVVIDGLAAGSALELLSVQRGVKALAPFGTLNRLAAQVGEFLADPDRFAVVLTVSPEELALRETLQAAASLREQLGIHCAAAVLNGVVNGLFSKAELKTLNNAGPFATIAERRRVMAEGAQYVRRELKRAGMPIIELPMLFEAMLGPAQVDSLSHALAAGLGLR
jgi:anion-transporting  ArsA/GET3 family ATPase